MGNLIIGSILAIIGFLIFIMAKQPIESRPAIVHILGPLTPLIYSGFIIGGLYLCFGVQWYFPIIVFFTAPLIAEIIRKAIS